MLKRACQTPSRWGRRMRSIVCYYYQVGKDWIIVRTWLGGKDALWLADIPCSCSLTWPWQSEERHCLCISLIYPQFPPSCSYAWDWKEWDSALNEGSTLPLSYSKAIEENSLKYKTLQNKPFVPNLQKIYCELGDRSKKFNVLITIRVISRATKTDVEDVELKLSSFLFCSIF